MSTKSSNTFGFIGSEGIIRDEIILDTAFWDFVPGMRGTRNTLMVDISLTI